MSYNSLRAAGRQIARRRIASRLGILLAVALLSASVRTLQAADSDPLMGYQERTVSVAVGGGKPSAFKYLLLKPEKLEPGKKYPVVLFLHGAGERGNDNRAQLQHFPETMSRPGRRQKYPCFVIAPQCPAGQKWVEINWSSRRSTPQAAEPTPAMQSAIAALNNVLTTEPADRSRVYLTGLSMGGYGSWDLGSRHPEWFAAVAPICGGGDEAKAAALAHTPLWAFHGGRDTVVPTARSRQMIDAIRKAGGDPKYTELPGVGHDAWTRAYADDSGLLDWMFQQTRPAAATVPPPASTSNGTAKRNTAQ